MRFRPGRRFVGILKPMDQAGLIARVGQPRHHATMHAQLHKGAHRPLVPPHSAGPKGAAGIRAGPKPPVARLAWWAARIDCIKNPSVYRQDRTRSRVIETKGIRTGADASGQKVVRLQQSDQFRGPFPSLLHLSSISVGEGLR